MIERIEDEPVRFFLRHRAQIEEWAALVSEAKQIALQAMTTVGDRIAESPPAGAEILFGDEGAFDARLLYRPEWLDGDGHPMAAVGIGWHTREVDFTPSPRCWIGVWRGRRDDPDPFIELLQSSLAEPAAALGLNKRDSTLWLLYKYPPGPSGEFWDDLRPWLKELEDEVHRVWERIADEIDLVLHGRSSTSA